VVGDQRCGTQGRALAARRAAREAEQRADSATALAVDRLIAAGFTVRDAGRMLGLSPQRVSQISHATHEAEAG